MKKLFLFLSILVIGVVSSACVNTFAVQELNQIATEYLNEGDIKGAISRLESSIDLDPNIYESRYNLAVAYLRINECEKALKQIIEAEKLVKDEPAVFYTLGVSYNCSARNLYEDKNSEGEIVEKVYEDETQAKLTAKKYVEYLTNSNKNFDKYTALAPNAEDTQSVMDTIRDNESKIKKCNEEYELLDSVEVE